MRDKFTGSADKVVNLITFYAQEVREVLAEIGADEIPRLEIYNKIDLLAKDTLTALRGQISSQDRVATTSAVTGGGIDTLLQVIETSLSGDELATARPSNTARPANGASIGR